VHGFDVRIAFVSDESQSERVDEATKAANVITTSAASISHNAATCKMKRALLVGILGVVRNRRKTKDYSAR
jgi:hypothetical protein